MDLVRFLAGQPHLEELLNGELEGAEQAIGADGGGKEGEGDVGGGEGGVGGDREVMDLEQVQVVLVEDGRIADGRMRKKERGGRRSAPLLVDEAKGDGGTVVAVGALIEDEAEFQARLEVRDGHTLGELLLRFLTLPSLLSLKEELPLGSDQGHVLCRLKGQVDGLPQVLHTLGDRGYGAWGDHKGGQGQRAVLANRGRERELIFVRRRGRRSQEWRRTDSDGLLEGQAEVEVLLHQQRLLAHVDLGEAGDDRDGVEVEI